MEFKTKKVPRDRKKHFITIKESIHQEDITIKNVYAFKNRASQYLKQEQMEIKEDIGENQDGGIGRHTAPPRTTRTDRKSNGKEARHQGNKK